MKNKHWYDYLWIVSLTYLVLGFFNILFAWLGLACFFIPLIISIVKGEKTYEVTKVNDSMWKYKEIADYVGSDVVPAFTSGTDYNFSLAPLNDGSYVYAIEVSGPDASTEWEEEYFIDLATAGFYQDTSYDYDEGYGYIFVASDSSCVVQFYYYSDANVFRIYIYA